jgi:purine-binding chemotaxis protein CheW
MPLEKKNSAQLKPQLRIIGVGKQATLEQKKAILRFRAEKLAQEQPKETADNDLIEFIEFSLANEKYGIESIYVREVYPYKDVTWLPCVPTFVSGLINVRRKIFSVIDLRVFFELSVDNPPTKVIILEKGGMEFAIVAETIVGSRLIPSRSLQASLPTLTGIRENFLKGVNPEGIVILDGEKLLSDKEIIIQENVTS